VLAEIGPGRGTLMADILRTIRAVPEMAAAVGIHLIEASPGLRTRQAEALKGHAPTWHDRITDLPERPLFLVANEFFDALPIRQFVRSGPGWRERQVGLADGTLVFGLGPVAAVDLLAARLADTREGDVVEVCPALPGIAGEVAGRIAAHGGAAVVIDYGGWHSRGDTLQALTGHRMVDPLAAPGEADLTAHVDFEALAAAFGSGGAAVSAMTPQGVFLERLGITLRAQALAARLTGAALSAHVAAHRRLTHPDEMGHLFKVIACHPTGAPPPPGLEP
jgi:NADH dehydrogenase [ubiquinone] 1 alpha subcomplex assembly factor 7